MKELQLTKGSIGKNLIRFSLPFMLSSFLQTFYGLADLFIAGRFNAAATITAVSIGSQIMHMLTVVIVGLAMGATVAVGHVIGAGEKEKTKKIVGNTISLFIIVAVLLTTVLLCGRFEILRLLSTPAEALKETGSYVMICGSGIVFICLYNVISGIYRGFGDSKTPMYFVALSGVVNIALDYVLIGKAGMGAAGAASATVLAQALSVLAAYLYAGKHMEIFRLSLSDFLPDSGILFSVLKVGIPVAAQDGFIQISFLVITAIVNMLGVDAAAAVGIVEKLICFMFLVPSAMLSSVSAITAQNLGAGQEDRCRKTLWYAIAVCIIYGMICCVICWAGAERIIMLFDKDETQVIKMGAQYLKAYVIDCILAGIHFCFSGYFCAYEKAYLSFVHNLAAILLLRIPGAYLAFKYYPDNLFPMGLAAPAGSLLSSIICILAYFVIAARKNKRGK